MTAGVRAFTYDEYKGGPTDLITTNLTLAQDAARANLGGNWRMPTYAEFVELRDNCNVVGTENYNGTGVKGCIFTSKTNGSSVFFPAAGMCNSSQVRYVGSEGFYWSVNWSSGWSHNNTSAYSMEVRTQGSLIVTEWGRSQGFSVRGVCK